MEEIEVLKLGVIDVIEPAKISILRNMKTLKVLSLIKIVCWHCKLSQRLGSVSW